MLNPKNEGPGHAECEAKDLATWGDLWIALVGVNGSKHSMSFHLLCQNERLHADVNNSTDGKLSKIRYTEDHVRLARAAFYLYTFKQLFSNTCRTLYVVDYVSFFVNNEVRFSCYNLLMIAHLHLNRHA